MTDPIQQIEENLRAMVIRAKQTYGSEGLMFALIATDISNLLKLVKVYKEYAWMYSELNEGEPNLDQIEKEIFGEVEEK